MILTKKDMRTNRGNRNNQERETNMAMFVAPVLILMLVGWGVYKLFIEPKKPISTESFIPYEPIQPAIGNIKAVIYIDNSGSMKGYANANTNAYLNVLSDLRGFYPHTDAIIGGENISGNELIDCLRLHRINYSNESFLHRDLELIATKAQQELEDSSNNVLPLKFYLTDGIMSGSNAQIKADSEYNRIHAQDLQNQMREALTGKDSIGISVYQFNSLFVGEYWAYDNEHHPIKYPRYFYVIAIGSRPVLSNFKHKVDSINLDPSNTYSKFIPTAQWHAIDSMIINTNLLVGPRGAVNYNGSKYTYKPKVINSQGGCVLFNLDTKVFINQYIEDMDTLASKSIVEIDGRIVRDVNVVWDKKAHAFTFRIPTNKLAKENLIRLTIPKLKNGWIDKSSTSNDKYMFRQPDNRTFLFDKFMQGIQSGISGASNPILYQREVKLKQE